MAVSKQKTRKKKANQVLRTGNRKLEHYIKPMLAKETAEAFDDKDWLFEFKWDGYRAIAEIDHGKVLLYSRNGNNFAGMYPALTNSLERIKQAAVLDGEIVVLNEKGFPDFQKLQHYEDNHDYPVVYFVFDLLKLNGHELYDQPLLERKKLLKKLLGKNSLVKYSDHVKETGKIFFKEALHKDLEGIMAKEAGSHYFPGKRTNNWLKIKNHKSTDVLIAGYTKPSGTRKYFGSLILAVKKGKEFKHVGHAGTGFDEELLKSLYQLMQPYKQASTPFREKITTGQSVTWLKPVLVCEVKFTEWTSDEKLRHPVFLTLRNDKSSKEIQMKNVHPVEKKISKKTSNEFAVKAGKINVPVSNPDKIYFPKSKITKKMIIDYYQSVAGYILPHLKNRPESLKRNPNGIKDNGFFQKDAGQAAPPFVQSIKLQSGSGNKQIDYILCNDKATLAYLNNLGCIELNPWHSQVKSLDKPDYIIIDIDPSAKNSFDQVIDAALEIKKVLTKAKVNSYCKTSGSSGLHIYVPLNQKYTYEKARDFAHIVCMIVHNQIPEFTSLERSLKKRGSSKIYLDYLQNGKGQTIASVYSVRPREGATVSMPLQWREVKHGLKPTDFTIHNALKRLKTKGDIFKPVLQKGINLEASLQLLQKYFL